jgi:putative copper export protein
MLPVTLDTVRLTLHVLAACVWVGGQVVLAGLVPTVRGLGPDAAKQVARAFARIAWPAYAVLVVTGVWNLLEVRVGDRTPAYHATLGLKLLVVAASGVSAGIHATTRTRTVLAVTGALTGVTALAAVLLGVQLARG